jgi:hypothetical protein
VAQQFPSPSGRPSAVFSTAAAVALGAPAPFRTPGRAPRARAEPSDLDRWSRRRTLAFIVGSNLCAWIAIIAGVHEALRAL